MLAVGGVCERTVQRLLAKLEESAGKAIVKIDEYLADELSGEWPWLRPAVRKERELPKLTRLMNALYDLARVEFGIADAETVKGKLLSLHEAWRRGLWASFARLLEISQGF
jgi:hypothetical protein